ncbi:MAG: diguanylate cyclase [Pseudomonadota bacterium]
MTKAQALQLHCQSERADLDQPRNLARMDVTPGQEPRYVVSRAAKFATMRTGVLTESAIVWSQHPFETIQATFFDRQFAVPLPDYEGQALAVFVEVDRVTQATTFDHMRLEREAPGTSREDRALLLLVAVFMGMMLMPILFDLGAYIILRERFIAWHALLVGSLGLQVACGFGLYAAFFEVHLPVVRVLTIGSFNLMIIAGIMFSLRFIERDKRSTTINRIVVGLTALFTACSMVHMAGIEALGRWPATVYFASGAPLGLALIAWMVSALRKGSRTVAFLIVGLSPLLLIALTRVVSFLLPGVPVVDANEWLLAAMFIEVVTTALGVATRFISLKRERDRFHAEKDRLEGVARHDALTGLYNRRAVDESFDTMRREGFDTFALLDLDHFKDINDRFGHQTGDAVLAACAKALTEGEARDCAAMRLGGEEFVLMLRGVNALDRAEALRQAIPRRVAADVRALDRLVTASMGVLEVPPANVSSMEFDTIYARADRLLYEAKNAGRNRMLFEKLTVFEPPKRGRAQKAA